MTAPSVTARVMGFSPIAVAESVTSDRLVASVPRDGTCTRKKSSSSGVFTEPVPVPFAARSVAKLQKSPWSSAVPSRTSWWVTPPPS